MPNPTHDTQLQQAQAIAQSSTVQMMQAIQSNPQLQAIGWTDADFAKLEEAIANHITYVSLGHLQKTRL